MESFVSHSGSRTLLPLVFCLANYRLLGDMVMHFPASQEEITLSTSSHRVSLRNHCEDEKSELSRSPPPL